MTADDDSPTRRHPNADERRDLRPEELHDFVRKAGRKTRKNADPNDRQYDHTLQKTIRRMNPDELDRLLRGETD